MKYFFCSIILFVCFLSILVFPFPAFAQADRTILWGGFYNPQLTDQLVTSMAFYRFNGFTFQDNPNGLPVASLGSGGPGRLSSVAYDNYVAQILAFNNKARAAGMDSLFITVWAAGDAPDPTNEAPVVNTFRELAKFAHTTGLRGIFIDAEDYSTPVWKGTGNYYLLGQHVAQGINAFDTNLDIAMAPQFNWGGGYDHYFEFARGMTSVLGTRMINVIEAPSYYLSDYNSILNQYNQQVSFHSLTVFGLAPVNPPELISMSYWFESPSGYPAAMNVPSQGIINDRQISQKYSFVYTENAPSFITGNSLLYVTQSILPPLTPLPPLTITPPQPAQNPADINKDGKVDMADFLILVQSLGHQGTSADINGDGVVSILDFNKLLQSYGK